MAFSFTLPAYKSTIWKTPFSPPEVCLLIFWVWVPYQVDSHDYQSQFFNAAFIRVTSLSLCSHLIYEFLRVLVINIIIQAITVYFHGFSSKLNLILLSYLSHIHVDQCRLLLTYFLSSVLYLVLFTTFSNSPVIVLQQMLTF